MQSPELTVLVERAEHLLWVIARSDVENLSAQRTDALRRLGELEHRALQFGERDLYRKVLLESPDLIKIVV